MTNPSDLKLGRKPGVVYDRRTLQLSRVMGALDMPVAPRVFTIAAAQTSFPLFANDRYGDCTCAAHGHRILAEERSSQQHEVTLTEKDVLAVYSAVTGFSPEDPSTDNGAYCLDVLNYMRKTGMGRERDGTPHTIGAFAQVRLSDHDQIRRATRTFGGAYVGAGLPLSAQAGVGRVWDEVDAGDVGSWGGHCMYVRGWTPDGPVFVTWGQNQKATWKWWDAYVDEAYVVISEDYLRGGKTTPQGLDVGRLKLYLESL